MTHPPTTDNDPGSLIEADRVHRDLYLSEALFQAEQDRLFARAWIYAGHESQIPAAGDFFTVEIAGRPLIVVRQSDGSVRALANRCAHKGAMLTAEKSGNAGRSLKCPYHSWAYRLDGSLLAMPAPGGYEGTRLKACESGQGLARAACETYRGFIFVRITDGPDFRDYFGPALDAIDAMCNRSPLGELEVAGPPLRSLIRCNWKVYLENINDSLHANITHESAAVASLSVWKAQPEGTPKPHAFEQLLPFSEGTEFMINMGARVFPHGHSVLGTRQSIHSAYSQYPEYIAALKAAYGEQRTQEILAWAPQNAVLYPSIAIKAAPQTMRVLRPLSAERTLLEAWAFRPRGAPEALVGRTLLYNRMVFSPMSMVAHDDVHIFETVQRGLRNEGNDWVNLQRDFKGNDAALAGQDVSGIDEILMRNQYRAWSELMTGSQRE